MDINYKSINKNYPKIDAQKSAHVWRVGGEGGPLGESTILVIADELRVMSRQLDDLAYDEKFEFAIKILASLGIFWYRSSK